MFDNFELKGRGVNIVGYSFKLDNPNHVVVLIHGIGEHAGRFRRVAGVFNEAGIAVVSMDLRGHGKSEGVRGDTAPRTEVLKDVDALIDYAKELYPGVPVVLYGHSMGGGIVLDYRARGTYSGDVSGYVISAPWLKLVADIPEPVVNIIKGFSKLAPKMKIKSSCAEEDLGNPLYVRPYKDDPMVHSYITLRASVDGFLQGKAIAAGRNEDNMKSVGIPCLHMHGTDDKICDVNGSRDYAKLKRNADDPAYIYKELPGYYHEIHNGGPGLTGDEVIKDACEFILGI